MQNVLIYGPRKSGSTLLQRMLDGGNLFVLPSETKIKKYPKFIKNIDITNEKHISTNQFYKAYFNASQGTFENFNNNNYDKTIIEGINEVKNLKKFISLDIKATLAGFNQHVSDFSGWIIKEVGGDPDYIISQFLKSYPNGKVILNFRNPAYITRSVYRDRRRKGIKLNILKMYIEAKKPWKVIIKQSKYINDPRIFRVDYENLINNPQKSMEAIATFLNIPFNDIFLYPTLNSKKVVVLTASKKTKKIFISKDKVYTDLNFLEYLMISVIGFFFWMKGKVIKNNLIEYG